MPRPRWSHEATEVQVDAIDGVVVIHFSVPNEEADRSIQMPAALAERLRQEIDAALPPKQPPSEIRKA